jgi:hypothetical protein
LEDNTVPGPLERFHCYAVGDVDNANIVNFENDVIDSKTFVD